MNVFALFILTYQYVYDVMAVMKTHITHT